MNTAFEDISSFLPQSPGWMHSGVALLADGDLVCAHPEGHSLLRINLHEGTREIPTSLTEMHSIVAATWRNREVIAVADPGHRFVPDPRDGSQYVEYSRDGRAVLLDLEGCVLLELPQPDLEAYASRPWRPTSIAVDDRLHDGSGDIWVADGYGENLLHRFSGEGEHLQVVDGSATGQAFDCPHGIALHTTAGTTELYVADRTNCRLVVLRTDGTPVRIVGEGQLDSPSSLAFQGDRLFVTELFGSVLYFDNDVLAGHIGNGRSRKHTEDQWPNRLDNGALTAPTHECARFNSPHGITVAAGHLYLTEWHIGGRLVRLPLHGISSNVDIDGK